MIFTSMGFGFAVAGCSHPLIAIFGMVEAIV